MIENVTVFGLCHHCFAINLISGEFEFDDDGNVTETCECAVCESAISMKREAEEA